MFGYRSMGPRVSLTTDRMVVRLVNERDAWRMADYYAGNRDYLMPWEPIRDQSYFQPSGWQTRLSIMAEQQRQGAACYFILTDPDSEEVMGWLTSVMWYEDVFMPVIWDIRSAKTGRDRD